MIISFPWLNLAQATLLLTLVAPCCFGETLANTIRPVRAGTGLEHGLIKSERIDTMTLELPPKSSNDQGVRFVDQKTAKHIPVPEPAGFLFAMLAVFTLLGGRHLMPRPRD